VTSSEKARERWRSVAQIAALLFVMSTGCSLSGFRDRIDTVIGSDDPKAVSYLSTHHNDKGLHYLAKGKVGKAETHFLKALNSDPRSASAHNNIGNMMLSRHELYKAAWEFQRASELAPNEIEPLVNLGLVHEEGDRLDDATDYYRRALELAPNNAVAVGNLARVLVKQDADVEEIHGVLKHLVFVDSRPDWLEWAEELIATRYSLQPSPRGRSQSPTASEPVRQSSQPQTLVMPETIHWIPEAITPSKDNPTPFTLPNTREYEDSLPNPIRTIAPPVNPFRTEGSPSFELTPLLNNGGGRP
jgi:hypothetical protein